MYQPHCGLNGINMRQIIASILFLFSAATYADEYLLAGVGQVNGSLDAPSLGASATFSSSAFELAAGYKFNDSIALEAVYIRHGSAKLVGGTADGYSAGIYALAKTSTLCENCSGNDWSLFGKLGIVNAISELKPAAGYALTSSSSQTKVVPAISLGVEVKDHGTNPTMLRVSYYRYAGGDEAISELFSIFLVSAGMTF